MTDLVLRGSGGRFEASVAVPGDKSLSHRALIFAGMAEGDSVVRGLGTGQDIASTASILIDLGIEIEGEAGREHRLRSQGIDSWTQPAQALDCGNSGTTMRLLAGALSTSAVEATLTGDASLSNRPMNRLVEPLRAIGGVIEPTNGSAPLNVGGASGARAADVELPIASAQVRTAFELGALAGDGSSTIDSPAGFRDHTERWLEALGRGSWVTDTRFRIDPGPLPAGLYEVPGDPSSAAFMWACAALHEGSVVTTPRVSLNPGRLGFLQILEQMGAQVDADVTGDTGGDPIGDVTVTGAGLVGTTVDGDLVAAALDELPLVAVLGSCAEGLTSVRDAAELRGKESDRIDAVVDMVRALDGGAEAAPDGFDIVGTGMLGGGTVATHHDHRIAMAAAIAATVATDAVTIEDAEVAAVSWPGFYSTLEGLWL
ncbi:MAG: 3-phosphoshikimate 1-carboxyvinyltransferase [Acidimicrobiia bacterium]